MFVKPSRGLVGLVMVVGLAALLATPAQALGPVKTVAAPSIRGDARSILGQFGILTVVPIDPEQAFVEGYAAYRAHDQMKTIERMTLAADKYPALADYALFFLGSAQRDSGDNQNAAATFRRLSYGYPQSVFADEASLQYAGFEFKLGRLIDAQAAAATLIARNPAPDIDQQARLFRRAPRSALATRAGAFRQLQALREKYPQGAADDEARTLAYSIAAAHPGSDRHATRSATIAARPPCSLREGQSSMALSQADDALALEPPASVHAEMLWLRARASAGQHRPRDARAQRLSQVCAARREGSRMRSIGWDILQWRTGDTKAARATFTRLVEGFPASELAPAAMFDIGRSYEDDDQWDLARAEYLRLVRSYPHSDAGRRWPLPRAVCAVHDGAVRRGGARVRLDEADGRVAVRARRAFVLVCALDGTLRPKRRGHGDLPEPGAKHREQLLPRTGGAPHRRASPAQLAVG